LVARKGQWVPVCDGFRYVTVTGAIEQCPHPGKS
jgi:hypothetical protein